MNLLKPWEEYVKPFKIADNLYFVGAKGGSSHVIDTGEGLIMIDSGYPQTLYQVIHNMHLLNLDPMDLKYIVHSHGHYDHLGATKALKELTGAKTVIGAPDREYANGTLDLTWARELGAKAYEEAFEPDILINDGDVISLGNTKIECVSTPGHTPGTMSFFFEVFYKGKSYTCGTHGGLGLNSMMKEFLDAYGLSYDCRDAFVKGLDRVRNRKVEIFIGNHVGNNDTLGKAAKMTEDYNPFIDETAWPTFIDIMKDYFFRTFKDEL
jgi:metallo-beta-lactamase class B